MLTRRPHRYPVTRRLWATVAIATLVVVLPLTAATLSPAADQVPVVIPTDVSRAPQPGVVAADRVARSPRPLSAAEAPDGAPRARVRVPRPAIAEPHTTTATPAPVDIVQAPSFIAGTVVDQTGAVIPGARLSIVSEASGTQSVVTNAEGRFVLNALRPARYILLASVPGFTAVSQDVTLTPGEGVQPVIVLPLGTLEESISVTCGGGIAALWNRTWDALFPVLSAQAAQGGPFAARPEPIRVGGNVQVPKRLSGADPVCPAASPRTAGTVTLFGRIGPDGAVSGVTVVPGLTNNDVPRELRTAAVDAVRQWLFSPARLNGQPMPLNMTVRVSFNGR